MFPLSPFRLSLPSLSSFWGHYALLLTGRGVPWVEEKCASCFLESLLNAGGQEEKLWRQVVPCQLGAQQPRLNPSQKGETRITPSALSKGMPVFFTLANLWGRGTWQQNTASGTQTKMSQGRQCANEAAK